MIQLKSVISNTSWGQIEGQKVLLFWNNHRLREQYMEYYAAIKRVKLDSHSEESLLPYSFRPLDHTKQMKTNQIVNSKH